MRGTGRRRLRLPDDRVSSLIDRCRRGDGAAWDSLYRGHAPAVARFLRRATGRPDEVDDLVQQVFVAVFQGLGAWRGEGRFTSWLFGIASRVALEHARAAARRTRREDGWSATLPANHDAGTDPCGAAGARAALRVVEAALSGMGFTTRTVWLMHEVEGLAAPEIARALGSTGVAVRVRLLRARRKVHEALAASGMGRPEVFDAS